MRWVFLRRHAFSPAPVHKADAAEAIATRKLISVAAQKPARKNHQRGKALAGYSAQGCPFIRLQRVCIADAAHSCSGLR
jgi:hypothetical protein